MSDTLQLRGNLNFTINLLQLSPSNKQQYTHNYAVTKQDEVQAIEIYILLCFVTKYE